MKSIHSSVLKLTLLMLLPFTQMSLSYGQEEETYVKSEYIEAENNTYTFQAKCSKNEYEEYEEVIISVYCSPGNEIKETPVASFTVFLNVVEMKKNEIIFRDSRKESKDSTKKNYSYILKTEYKDLKTDVRQSTCDGIGMLQLKLGLANQVSIGENIMIVTMGDQDLTFNKSSSSIYNDMTMENPKSENKTPIDSTVISPEELKTLDQFLTNYVQTYDHYPMEDETWSHHGIYPPFLEQHNLKVKDYSVLGYLIDKYWIEPEKKDGYITVLIGGEVALHRIYVRVEEYKGKYYISPKDLHYKRDDSIDIIWKKDWLGIDGMPFPDEQKN